MTFAQQRQVRAALYRTQAAAQMALGEKSGLTQVREKHEQAAARWTALAELDERPMSSRPAWESER
jgi:hypothetical protein